MVKKYPYLIGDFIWTAWDYLGEAGIGAWAYTPDGKGFSKPYPWLLGDTGALDILGTPNGEALWAAAIWGKGTFMAVQPINHDARPAKAAWRGTNAIPSWSWKDCEGRKAVVEVYTDAARVELLLNGSLVGKAKVKDCRAICKVKYAPGTLTAVCYDISGQEAGRSKLSSANSNLRIALTPEKSSAKPGEILYIPVQITDEAGTVECNADRRLTVTVGGGELLAFGSANPRTEERYDSGSFTTYYGQALAVVRAGTSGSVAITASDGVLKGIAEIVLQHQATGSNAGHGRCSG